MNYWQLICWSPSVAPNTILIYNTRNSNNLSNLIQSLTNHSIPIFLLHPKKSMGWVSVPSDSQIQQKLGTYSENKVFSKFYYDVWMAYCSWNPKLELNLHNRSVLLQLNFVDFPCKQVHPYTRKMQVVILGFSNSISLYVCSFIYSNT